MALDPIKLMRPDFRDGRALRLRDGQDWVLPFPVLSGLTNNYARYNDDGSFDRILARPTFVDPIHDQIIEDIIFGDTPEIQNGAVIQAGIHLLRLNYDLTHKQASRLMQFQIGREEDEATYTAIWRIAIGLDDSPKPSPDGVEPS